VGKVAYNFKTKRGKISDVYTQIDEGYYRGENIKRRETGELYVEGGRYTTCNHPNPHYWFYGDKMKIIPGDRVISRPLVLYVEGVPVFAVPFMFFPSNSGQTSGIVVPRYGYDNTIGYNISQGGYYWYINDYMDWLNEGDISFNGSWRMRSRFRYAERYKFVGSISAEFQRQFRNEETDPDYAESEGWNVTVDHVQDFDPSTKAKVNLQFASNKSAYNLNSFNPTDIISQQATSYASLTKTFDEGQRSIDLSYQRTQLLSEKNTSQSFSLSFYQGQFFPFKGRRSVGEGLLEKISVVPGGSVSGAFNNTDVISTANWTANTNLKLQLQKTFSPNFQATFSQSINMTGQLQHTSPASDLSGIRITMPLAMQSTVFKYFNFNPSFTVNKFFVDRTLTKTFNPADSSVTTTEENGRAEFTTYSLSASLQTRLYGTVRTGILESLFGLKALRHTLVPNFSYNYTPDFSRKSFGYYGSYIDENGKEVRYDRFGTSLFRPGAGESQTLGISLSNIFEAKVRQNDTTKTYDDPKRGEATYQFLTLSLSSGYNFAADSLNIQQLNISAATTTLAPYFTLSANALYDFYSYDKTTGQKINKLYIKDTGSPLRLISANINLSSRLVGTKQTNPDRLVSRIDSTALKEQQQKIAEGLVPTDFNRELGRNVDFDIPWELSVNLNLSANRSNPLISTIFNAQMNVAFRVSPTPNWQLSASATYDFSQHKLNFPTLIINRDLHCWQMNFQWTPIGEYRSYFFQIGIKAPQLQDIRIEKRDSPIAIFEK
ncbi:MAG: LPS-assembly protein LptD, partial [Chlorobiales bacterium]|nr:LPS-assembly protein LptD [Chlorobiales bacterium]